jgi:Interferon-induced transmembrane protein/DnaJ domain
VSRSRLRDLDGEDPYELLGVDPAADHGAIVSAYRRRIRSIHPDLPTGDLAATRLLHVARDILLDPLQRAEYDRSLTAVEPRTDPGYDAAGTGYTAPASAWDADDVVSGYVTPPASAPPDPSSRTGSAPRRRPFAPPPYEYPPPRRPFAPPPPPYQPPQPRHPSSVPVPFGTNMAASIVAFFFFWPFAIPAITFANRAAAAMRAGDYEAAWRAAVDSRRWSRLAFVVGAVALGLVFVCCCAGYLLPLLATSVTPTPSN